MDLLGKLKTSDVTYPPDMLAARRQHYLQQIANIGFGMGASAGIKNTAKGGNGIAATATLTSKILETILVAAIAIEASTAAYIYRSKIADIFKTHTSSSNVHETVHPSRNISSSNSKLVEATETPFATVTVIASSTNTPSATPSDTPSSGIVASNNNNNGGANVNSTPNPNGNNGNHYGQTPKPERTKDNNKGGNNNNNDGNNNHHNSGNGHNGGGDNNDHGGDNNHHNGGGNGNHNGGGNKP